MKIKDLLKLFSNFDEDLEVKMVCSFTKHTCGDNYCYCSSEDYFFSISNLEKETKYNKKSKKQQIVGICIRAEEKI